jgi:8-oxo-dGTP diphosphatase
VLYLVRHAKAGSRHNWIGDDRERPLTKGGWQQAQALVKPLRKLATGTLVSSPYLRCTQTLQPLAERLARKVDADERLAEGGSFGDVLEMLAALADGSVLCSHGDVIPDTIAALERRGCRIASEPDWRKASTWVLERDDGEIVRATCWPPPDV